MHSKLSFWEVNCLFYRQQSELVKFLVELCFGTMHRQVRCSILCMQGINALKIVIRRGNLCFVVRYFV